jgi:SAM-dependent methyltransferase
MIPQGLKKRTPQSLKRFAKPILKIWRRALWYWIRPVFDARCAWQIAKSYEWYISDWRIYSKLPGAERLRFEDSFPCLQDRTATTPFDSHYFYQDIWAFKAIKASGAPSHVDVGSRVIFVGMLTTITKVTFIDIRPLIVNLENFESKTGSILALPFSDRSVSSLSCLSVAEHIGLGRYGDPIDPLGTKKAARELARVLAPGGSLYFSVPVGRPRVCFNAHRIHSPQQILEYFYDLKLVQFSGVGEDGTLREGIAPDDFKNATFATGLFHFTKEM